MKFRDLLENGFIGDKDIVNLDIVINDESRKLIGAWYEDVLLNCMDFEIDNMNFDSLYEDVRKMWRIRLIPEHPTPTEKRYEDLTCCNVAPSPYGNMFNCKTASDNAVTEDKTC